MKVEVCCIKKRFKKDKKLSCVSSRTVPQNQCLSWRHVLENLYLVGPAVLHQVSYPRQLSHPCSRLNTWMSFTGTRITILGISGVDPVKTEHAGRRRSSRCRRLPCTRHLLNVTWRWSQDRGEGVFNLIHMLDDIVFSPPRHLIRGISGCSWVAGWLVSFAVEQEGNSILNYEWCLWAIPSCLDLMLHIRLSHSRSSSISDVAQTERAAVRRGLVASGMAFWQLFFFFFFLCS